jgi:hypothetical protein
MLLLKILGIFLLWFVAGAVINIMLYGVKEIKPDSDAGKFLHIVLNITALIWVFSLIFS